MNFFGRSFENVESIHSHCCSRHLVDGPKKFDVLGAKPHYAPDRLCNVNHIRLQVSFDIPNKTMFGLCTTSLTAIADGTKFMKFDAVNLVIETVKVNGRSAEFATGDDYVKVYFPEPLARGGLAAVEIKYKVVKPRLGLYFTEPDKGYPNKPLQIWTQGQDEDSRYWFPCHDSPNQKATTEMIATVPESFFALSNGALIDVAHDKSKREKTYHWKLGTPHVAYLVTLAAGELSEFTDYYQDIPVQYYVQPGREREGRNSFSETARMVQFFSERIGVKYPYEKYAQVAVADFVFGGMENTSATTQTDLTLHDDRAHLDFSSDGLVSHELAHQWFGDLLTCKHWSHGWLNEGFATYFEALWAEHKDGEDEFRYNMIQKLEDYFAEDSGRYRRAIVSNVYAEPIDIFDAHLYQKASCVLNLLRYMLGTDIWWKVINHYVNKHRGQTVESIDLLRAIEDITGRNFQKIFDQWIFKAGHPEFTVDYSWDDEDKSATLKVKQTQKEDELTSIFTLPIEIEFTFEDSSRFLRKVDVDLAEHTFYFQLKEKPKSCRFDPKGWIPKTLAFTKPKDMLLWELEHDKTIHGRIEAAKELAKNPSSSVIEALGKALRREKFWGVQARIAKALGGVKEESAMRELIDSLSVKHPKARRAVVEALGNFKEDAVAEALIPILKKDDSYLVESSAARSLGATKSGKAFEPLIKALDKDSWVDVIRSGVFDGLAELGDEKGIHYLKKYSKYGSPEMGRFSAIRGLGKIGENMPNATKKDIAETLIKLLEEDKFRTRMSVIASLQTLKHESALGPLGALAGQNLDGRVKAAAGKAVKALRAGLDKGDAIKKLQDDFEKLNEENRKLRGRLEKIEDKSSGKSKEGENIPAKGKDKGKSKSKKSKGKKK